MNSQALVTVLLPAYNAEEYLDRAVQSILLQSYNNFELIIINDGSKDGTWDLIESYSDPRVVGVNFEQNQGLIHVLNHGLKIAQGKYIARMDADDISLHDRFIKQVKYLEDHLDCGVCGSAVVNFNDSGSTCKMIYPYKHKEIIAALTLFERNICHPTAMLRTSVLRENNILYKKEYYHAEDYMLWLEMSQHSKLNNLRDPLLMYYRHNDQVSSRHYAVQMNTSRRIVKEQLEEYLSSGERLFPENVYIDFLVQEINGTRSGITEGQSKEVYKELLGYIESRDDLDYLYARNILLFKAFRAAFQYKYSMVYKVKSAFACLFKGPRLLFLSVSAFVCLVLISRLKSKRKM